MAPCEIEIYQKDSDSWIKVGDVQPNDPPGSISNNRRDGAREIFLLECATDNSQTTIYRSRLGLDTEVGKDGKVRVVLPNRGLEVIKILKKGESHEMEITTDRGRHAQIRFSHK